MTFSTASLRDLIYQVVAIYNVESLLRNSIAKPYDM